MKITTGKGHDIEIKTLLRTQKLPVDDLPERLDNFVVAFDSDEVIGVAGLEVYGNNGLLRSVAVATAYRNQGIAAKLINEIETRAATQGLTELFLLTETASEYFAKEGFDRIDRDNIAPQVKQSSEFSHVCPISAIAMKKILKP
jgi:amino-acid N-acetyltransferase